MRTITALTAQKRNKDRVNVYLDGEFAFGLARDVAAGLRVGQSLAETDVTLLQEREEVARARETAVRYLSYRPRSESEVRRRLARDYDDAVIDAAIERLRDVDLIDDVAFADYWVEQRETFKPRGRLALSHELRQKGVSRGIIETAVSQVDEWDAARRAARKKARRYARLDKEAFRRKLGRFLQRRGFPYPIIKDVTQDIWQEWHADTPQ